MFKERLYRIIDREDKEGGVRYRVELDPEDPLFQGHFPGQPVLPAACMLEMGRELMEDWKGYSLRVHHIKNMKIPSMVDPRKVPRLELDLELKEDGDPFSCRFTVASEGTVFFKFQGEMGGA